jgi:hypothetical protein
MNTDFEFKPLPALEHPVTQPFESIADPLGPLALLKGAWKGTGFNVIWRPNHTPASDHFLELNLTSETIEFDEIGGPIPNRGLLQRDINMFGLTYLQKISDTNLNAGLHIEPGIWAAVPKTTAPAESATVVRMASIPHGTTILAQGTSIHGENKPKIPVASITPFGIGHPHSPVTFSEQQLSFTPAPFRSPAPQLVGVTQAMVDNPNSVLDAAIAGQNIRSFTELHISTLAAKPLVGGGTDNTAFLRGNTGHPNAVCPEVHARFWIEDVVHGPGEPNTLQLQYTQTVLLNFAGLSWPHITVGTLTPA